MTIIKPVLVAAALLALVACNPPQTRSGGLPGSNAGASVTPGDPTAPTAARPQGAAPGMATGGGVPVPTRPGGAGGVGSGNAPGLGGTGSGSGSR